MTAAELRSEAFRDLLNDNQCEDKELRTALAQGISDFDIVVREAKLTIDAGCSTASSARAMRRRSPCCSLRPLRSSTRTAAPSPANRRSPSPVRPRARASTTRSTAATRRPTARSTPARSRSRSPQRSRPSPSRTAARPARSSRQRSRRTSRHRLCRCGGGRLVLRRRPVGRRCGCHERHEQGSFLARYELHPRAGGHVPVERRRQARRPSR